MAAFDLPGMSAADLAHSAMNVLKCSLGGGNRLAHEPGNDARRPGDGDRPDDARVDAEVVADDQPDLILAGLGELVDGVDRFDVVPSPKRQAKVIGSRSGSCEAEASKLTDLPFTAVFGAVKAATGAWLSG
jgi:hypothetical protein